MVSFPITINGYMWLRAKWCKASSLVAHWLKVKHNITDDSQQPLCVCRWVWLCVCLNACAHNMCLSCVSLFELLEVWPMMLSRSHFMSTWAVSTRKINATQGQDSSSVCRLASLLFQQNLAIPFSLNWPTSLEWDRPQEGGKFEKSFWQRFCLLTWDRKLDSCDTLVTLPSVGTRGAPGKDLWERLESVFDYSEPLWVCTITVIS